MRQCRCQPTITLTPSTMRATMTTTTMVSQSKRLGRCFRLFNSGFELLNDLPQVGISSANIPEDFTKNAKTNHLKFQAWLEDCQLYLFKFQSLIGSLRVLHHSKFWRKGIHRGLYHEMYRHRIINVSAEKTLARGQRVLQTRFLSTGRILCHRQLQYPDLLLICCFQHRFALGFKFGAG